MSMFGVLVKGFIFIFVTSIVNPSWSITIKCTDFDKEAEQLKVAVDKKQKELSKIEEQLNANHSAIKNFNKNCRAASSPQCNPMVYNMISGQSVVLIGKQQSFTNIIRALESKREDALEKKRSCLLALKKEFY